MKYDLRINNAFFRVIEGSHIQDALLNDAGLDVDFIQTANNTGEIEFSEDADIREIVNNDEFASDEILDEVKKDGLQMTFGPAESA